MAKTIELKTTITLEEEQLFNLLEECEVKRPSQTKVKKLIKLFEEVESDIYEQMEEALQEALKEIIYNEFDCEE